MSGVFGAIIGVATIFLSLGISAISLSQCSHVMSSAISLSGKRFGYRPMLLGVWVVGGDGGSDERYYVDSIDVR